jgi:hypothetical protein
MARFARFSGSKRISLFSARGCWGYAHDTSRRGAVPSAELVPMQFRMHPAFVKAFKQAALDRDMKLNELLQTIFDAFIKTSKKG